MNSLLTIIIPTKNRPFLLNRTLLYYVKSKISANIMIADSSALEFCGETRGIFDKYSNDLNIEYLYVPDDTDLFKKYSICSENITTPYVLTIGDDDFPIKTTLNKLVLKLENDKSIAAIFGERVAIMKISKEYSSSNEEWIKTYPNYSGVSNTSRNPLDRIKKLPIPNWQQYQNSIIRTNIFKKSIHMVADTDYTQYSEFFFSAMVLIHGIWVKSDSLFAVCHQESKFCKFKDRYLFPHYIGNKGSVFSGISQDKWSEVVTSLCNFIGKELSVIHPQCGNFCSDKIRKIYLSRLFYFLEYNNKLSDNLIDEEKYFLRKINNIFRKLSKFYWIFFLHDRSGGIYEYIKFVTGLTREVLNGRIVRIILTSKNNVNIKHLLTSIKRVGSLDYESDALLRSSSKYNREYKMIYSIWKNDPCPQKLTKK